MSTVDQPLLIANSNYHVGQQVAIYVAEEQGFFQEEGFASYDYDGRGLIPGSLEREGIAMAMKEHGVDIVTAVDIECAISMDCSLHPRDSPGKNTGMGHHFLLQVIFLTQGSNSGLLNCRQILHCLHHQGSLTQHSL